MLFIRYLTNIIGPMLCPIIKGMTEDNIGSQTYVNEGNKTLKDHEIEPIT